MIEIKFLAAALSFFFLNRKFYDILIIQISIELLRLYTIIQVNQKRTLKFDNKND